MKLVKPLIVVGAATLMITGVATAGAATRQQDRQQLKDGSCTTAVVNNGAQNGIKAQDRQKLQDGSCLTTVAYRNGAQDGARKGARNHGQNGTGTHDRQRLHDGSCLTA
jgi:hypothetical protein